MTEHPPPGSGGGPLPRGTHRAAGPCIEYRRVRLDLYSPPYLFQGPRPEIGEAPDSAERGDTLAVTTPDPERIDRARLVRLASSTHVTSVDQRSVALDLRRVGRGLQVDVPASIQTVPEGFYMLFLVDDRGVPSTGHILRVGGDDADRTE